MKAIVLKRRNFRENDQIISLYTKEKGKLELLARGVKKITSKNSSHLEPFSLVEIELAHGKEIDYLTKVQSIEYFKNIRNDLEKSLASQYAVDLTDKLIQVGEFDERIFNILFNFLLFLNNSDFEFNINILLDSYVVSLLHCLGFTMSEDEKMNRWIDKLKILESGDLDIINKLEYNLELHKIIYKYLVYHVERKISDWVGLTKI